MFRFLLVIQWTIVVFATLGFVSAGADSYKWTDKDGNVVYSQTPPNSGEAELIKAPPPPDVDSSRNAVTDNEDEQDYLQGQKEQRNKQREMEDEQASRQARCEEQKHRLTKLLEVQRVYTYDDDGNRVRVGEEVREQRISQAQRQIAEFCDDAP